MNIEREWNIISVKYLSGEVRRSLWRKLAKLLRGSVPIMMALSTLHDSRKNLKGPKDPLVIALAEWIMTIKNGRRLADAIQGWVSDQETMLIAAGEQSGDLPKTLDSLSYIMKAQKDMKNAIIGGTMYPALLICMMFGMMYLFGVKVIPSFTRLAGSDDKWTGFAHLMVGTADFVQVAIIPMFLVMMAVFVAFFVSLSRWDGPLRVWADKRVPYSVYRMIQGGAWLVSFAALVEAGGRIEDSIDNMRKTAPKWMRNRLEGILVEIRSGYAIGVAMQRAGHGFPDVEIIDDLNVYGSQKGFDEALLMIGREWIADGTEKIQAAMKGVFSLGIIFNGVMLMFFVSGMVAMQMQLGAIIKGGF